MDAKESLWLELVHPDLGPCCKVMFALLAGLPVASADRYLFQPAAYAPTQQFAGVEQYGEVAQLPYGYVPLHFQGSANYKNIVQRFVTFDYISFIKRSLYFSRACACSLVLKFAEDV